VVYTKLDGRELQESCWEKKTPNIEKYPRDELRSGVLRKRGTEGLVVGYAAEHGLRSEREVALTADQVPPYRVHGQNGQIHMSVGC
jgi:hypothetical protein